MNWNEKSMMRDLIVSSYFVIPIVDPHYLAHFVKHTVTSLGSGTVCLNLLLIDCGFLILIVILHIHSII